MAIIYTYPIKTTSANRNDLILISDSADKNKTKQISVAKLPGGIDFVGVGGNGTAGKIPKWSTQYDLTDSSISEDSVTGNIGIGLAPNGSALTILDVSKNGLDTNQPIIRITQRKDDPAWPVAEMGRFEFFSSDGSGNSPYNLGYVGISNDAVGGTLPSGAMTFATTPYNATGGSEAAIERMRISSSGSVGIGTTRPNAELDIQGENVPLIRLTETATGGKNILLGVDTSNGFLRSSGNMLLQAGSSYQGISILESGNVGIGITNPDSILTVKAATANVGIPVIKSSVNGFNNGFTLIGDNYVAGESQFNLGISYSGANGVLSRSVKVSNTTDDVFLSSQDAYSTNPSAFILDRDGSFRFLNTSTNASTPVGTAVSLSERMRINSSGNVGIDNTNPSRKLTVGFGNQLTPALPLTVSNGFQSNWVSKLFFGSAIDWYRIAKIPQKNVARGGGILKFSLTGGNTPPTTYVINYWKYWTASVGSNSHTLKLEQYGPNLAFTKARISLATDGEVYIEVYKNTTLVFNSPPPVFHDSLLGYDGYQAEIIVSDSTNTLPSGSSGGSMEELPFISMGTSVKAIHVENTLNSVGNINLKNLPTSASGLVAGDIYNDGGTLKIFS